MSNCEETDVQGSHMLLGKRKRKKNLKKDHHDQVALKKDASWKKKKRKGSKCKDTLGTKKEKKKHKKKRKMSLEPDSDHVSHAQADPTAISITQSLCRRQDQEPKPKRKKKVGFDLSPGYIRVKRPQFASSSPKESAAFENKTLGDRARLTQDNNSPCNSEDVNSQDLFITQKTFRALSPEASSGETITATTAQILMQQIMKNEKCKLEGSTRGLYGQQHPWKAQVTEAFTEETEAEEKMRIKKMCCNYKNGETSRVKADLHGNSSKCANARPRVNHFPIETTDVSAPESWTSNQQISTSTQTENFFTTEFSSYLHFFRKVSACAVDLKPLDLSLPHRARKDPGMSATKSLLQDQYKGNGRKSPDLESHCSLKIREVKKEPSVRCMNETDPSSCFKSGSNYADNTASSGEEQPSRTKLDLTQVRLQDPHCQCVCRDGCLIIYTIALISNLTKLRCCTCCDLHITFQWQKVLIIFIFIVFRLGQFKQDSTSLFSLRRKETDSPLGQSLH